MIFANLIQISKQGYPVTSWVAGFNPQASRAGNGDPGGGRSLPRTVGLELGYPNSKKQVAKFYSPFFSPSLNENGEKINF